MSELNICYICNNTLSYVEMMGISIYSLIYNKALSTNLNIHIIHNGLNKEYQDKLQAMETAQVKLSFMLIPTELENLLAMEPDTNYLGHPETTYLGNSCLWRLYIPTLFSNYERILYIDCDTIIRKDLAELSTIDFEDNYCCATKTDFFNLKLFSYEYIKYQDKYYHKSTYYTKILDFPLEYFEKDKKPYVNAGILLFNIPKINKDNLVQKLIDNVNKYKECLILADQDVIPKTFGLQIKDLGIQYNFYTKDKDYHNASIIHIIGKTKLFHFSSWYRCHYFHEYIKYLQGSPFARNKYKIFILYVITKIRQYIVCVENSLKFMKRKKKEIVSNY
ncbi:glycosyltransferase family 8 protein [Candidatus Hepatincola sp. Av]